MTALSGEIASQVANVAVNEGINQTKKFMNKPNLNRKKMKFIREQYLICFGAKESEIPAELVTNDGLPSYPVDSNLFDLNYWEKRMPTGLFRPNASGMIASICEYQKHYSDSMIRNKLQFANNVLCEYMKNWLQKNPAVNHFNEQLYEEMTKFTEFIHAIERNESFIDDQSLIALLSQIRTKCQREIMPRLQLELANTAARDDMRQLQQEVRQFLDYGIRYLYYALRETEITNHNETTLDNLLTKLKSSTQADPVLQSLSGKCLIALLQQDIVANNFSIAPQQLTTVEQILNEQNIFCNNKMQLIIPDNVLLQKSKEQQAIIASPVSYFAKNNSGILEPFRTNTEILTTYLNLHSLLFELAKFVGFFASTAELSKQGGDLLLYGFANNSGIMSQLFHVFVELMSAIVANVKTIDEAMDYYYSEQMQQTKKSLFGKNAAQQPWAINHGKRNEVSKNIFTAKTRCSLVTDRISTRSKSLTLAERLEQAQTQTQQFLQLAAGEVTNLTAMLKLSMPNLISAHASDIKSQQSLANNKQLKIAPMVHLSIHASSTSSASNSTSSSSSSSTSSTMQSQHVTHKSNIPVGTKDCDYFKSKEREITDDNIDEVIKNDDIMDARTLLLNKNTRLTHKGIFILCDKIKATASGLVKLDFWQVPIGGDGLFAIGELLQNLPYLSELYVSECAISDIGCKNFSNYLKQNVTLQLLDIAYNEIGDIGAISLVEALKKHPKITTLRVGGNKISESGGKMLLELVLTNPNIISISLGRTHDPLTSHIPTTNTNTISDSTRENIAHVVEQNKTNMAMSNNLAGGTSRQLK